MFDEKLFYPLFGQFEKKFFPKLKHAVAKGYHFEGSKKEKIFFFKTLLSLQMLKDYRAPLVAIDNNLDSVTQLKSINDEIKRRNFQLDFSWVIWRHERMMARLARELLNREINLVGSSVDYNEFVLRYLVSIWLVDWEGPLYVLLQLTRFDNVNLRMLNKALALWDFTGIFTQKFYI